jgi:hypothetical protein
VTGPHFRYSDTWQFVINTGIGQYLSASRTPGMPRELLADRHWEQGKQEAFLSQMELQYSSKRIGVLAQRNGRAAPDTELFVSENPDRISSFTPEGPVMITLIVTT